MPFYCHQQNINLNASDVMSRNCSALALSASYNNVLQYCVYLVFFFLCFYIHIYSDEWTGVH